MIRRLLLIFVGVASVCLVPWTVFLGSTLPDQHDSDLWRLAWVGFNTGLLCCFVAATLLGLRRHRAAVPLLAATAALLCADAWFDVVLDWGQPDRWVSLLMAIVVELPVAGFLLLHARHLLTGGMPRRRLTVHDIEVHTDPEDQRLLRAVGDLAPVTTDTLAAALGRGAEELAASLIRLADAGYIRRRRDGRWRRPGPVDLRLPSLDEVDEADRTRVAAYIDAKFDRELQLLSWAVRHRDEFGAWGKGERAVAHLSEAELASLNVEYTELITRYCLLRQEPAAGTREVAVRFYAFPFHEPSPS